MLLEKLKNKTLQTLKASDSFGKKVSDIGYVYQDRATMSNE